MNMSFIDNSHFALLAENVDIDSKNEIKEFLFAFDNKFISESVLNKTEYDILNCSVTTDEIENAIDALKNIMMSGAIWDQPNSWSITRMLFKKIFVWWWITLYKW